MLIPTGIFVYFSLSLIIFILTLVLVRHFLLITLLLITQKLRLKNIYKKTQLPGNNMFVDKINSCNYICRSVSQISRGVHVCRSVNSGTDVCRSKLIGSYNYIFSSNQL